MTGGTAAASEPTSAGAQNDGENDEQPSVAGNAGAEQSAGVPQASGQATAAPDTASSSSSRTLTNQQRALIRAAVAVDAEALRKRKQEVEIHEDEAAYLAELPFELTLELSQLAINHVRLRGSKHMQPSDIDWAAELMLTGRKSSRFPGVATSIGGLLAGAGAPYIIDAIFASAEQLSTGSLALGITLTVPGLVLFSIGTTLSILRRG